jgi:DNA-binding SARP family transcriptional activator
MLRLQLLGAPTIHLDQRPIAMPSQKAQALLFYLAAEADRAFTRSQVIALLWEESDEKDGRNSLSTVLSRLRQALPDPPIRADGDLLAWNAAAARVDVREFHELTRPHTELAGDPTRLETAAALYHGPFLDGFGVRDSTAYDEWLRLERERWQYRMLNVLEQLVAHYDAEGDLARAARHARTAVELDPLQERFHRALMRLAALGGDRAAALAQFRACRELLERELGVPPDPETIALDAQIRAGELATRPMSRAVAASPAPALPAPIQAVQPAARLATRLEAARKQSFVGRRDELHLFAEALAQAEPPFTVLHLFGPGGVGKTTLLAAFARHCATHGIATLTLDGRSVEPTPAGILAALREQAGGEGGLDTLPEQVVVLVDTYEQLTPVEGWLRDALLPQLPHRALVVLAGRAPPSAAWRADLGWQAISRVVRLDNLSAEESADYLDRRGIPPAQHDAVLRATHGFPLGLSLAAEVILQRPGDRFEGLDTPDTVQRLLERFSDRVPSVAHRAALEAASQVRAVDESLLAAMLARDEARELFEWLQSLSFVSRGRRGVFLHDLAREALAADLRWRNPPWYRELHERARVFYAEAFERGSRTAQQQALLDLIFLHESLLIRSLFAWNDIGGLAEHLARPDDWPALEAMIRRHEGDESARIAAGWFAAQPGRVSVFRSGDGTPVGFNQIIALGPGDDDAGDPCVAAVLRFVRTQPPLATGETIAIDRFWMDDTAYQDISPTQGLIFVAATRYVLTTPGLACSFHVFADPDAWHQTIDQVRFQRLPEADFSVGGRRYGVVYHDWRAESPQAWLAALTEQEIHS